MKRVILLIFTILLIAPTFAQKKPIIKKKKKEKVQQVDSLGRKIKTGWNFGALPSIAFDADLGFSVTSNHIYYEKTDTEKTDTGFLDNLYFSRSGSTKPRKTHHYYRTSQSC